MRNTLKTSGLALLLAVNPCLNLPLYGSVLAQEDFESDTLNTTPDGFGISIPNDNTVLISDTTAANGTSQSVQLLTADPKDGYPAMSRAFTATDSGLLSISWYSRVEQLNSDSQYIQVRNSSNMILLGVRFDNTSNTFAYKSQSSSWVDLINPYTSGVWYNLQIDIDFGQSSWDFYVDNSLALDGGAFVTGVDEEAQNLYVQGQVSLGSGTGYFDELNIEVQIVPEPSTAIMLGGSLLAFLFSARKKRLHAATRETPV